MRDRIDARVVRVHESLAGFDLARAVLDERGRRVPTDEPAAAQMRLRETRVAEFGLGHDRDGPTEERGVPLDVERIGGAAAALHRPAQHVQHLLADEHAVAEDPVLRGSESGGDRGERGGGRRGQDRRDRASGHGRELGHVGRVLPQRVPAEAVEHEEHHGVGWARRFGEPGGVVDPQQGRDQSRDRRAVERRPHRGERRSRWKGHRPAA